MVNEQPRYITIKLDPEKDKVYGLNRLNPNKHTYVVEGSIDSLFLDNCIVDKLGRFYEVTKRKYYYSF